MPASAALVIDNVEPRIERAIRASSTIGEICEQPRWLVRYRSAALVQSANLILETFGYYSARIDTQLRDVDGCIELRLVVHAGPPTLIRSLEVSIVNNEASTENLQKTIANSTLRVGQQLDHETYDSLKTQLEDAALRYGYLEAQFSERTIEVNPDEQTADIKLIFDPGPRYRFGKVNFISERLSESLLTRYVPFKTGDYFDSEKLSLLNQQLRSSDYIDELSVVTGDADTADKTIPVVVTLDPGNHVSLKVGVGYSTDIGPTVTGERRNRLRNPEGHQTSLDLSLSEVRSEVGGDYRIPYGDKANGWLSVYMGYRIVDTDAFKADYTTLGVRRVLPRGKGWIETLFLEATNSDFELGTTDRTNLAVTPGVTFSYTSTDDLVARPLHAHRFSIELSGSDEALGSSVDYLSLKLSGKMIRPLGQRFRLIGRGRIGMTESQDFGLLPPRARFFSGGDAQVRGFDYQEIGTLDDNGDVIGGDRLLEGSVEIDYLFRKSWALALFIDGASVSLSSFEDTYERGAGIGVRWYSPIGPLRFDVAQGLGSGESVRFHVSFGPDV